MNFAEALPIVVEWAGWELHHQHELWNEMKEMACKDGGIWYITAEGEKAIKAKLESDLGVSVYHSNWRRDDGRMTYIIYKGHLYKSTHLDEGIAFVQVVYEMFQAKDGI